MDTKASALEMQSVQGGGGGCGCGGDGNGGGDSKSNWNDVGAERVDLNALPASLIRRLSVKQLRALRRLRLNRYDLQGNANANANANAHVDANTDANTDANIHVDANIDANTNANIVASAGANLGQRGRQEQELKKQQQLKQQRHVQRRRRRDVQQLAEFAEQLGLGPSGDYSGPMAMGYGGGSSDGAADRGMQSFLRQRQQNYGTL
jgi:hypothetical protein